MQTQRHTGGTRDIIVHERTGLLATGPDAWAREVGRLAHDTSLRDRLAEGIRAHVDAGFTADAVVARTVALYRDLVNAERGGDADA